MSIYQSSVKASYNFIPPFQMYLLWLCPFFLFKVHPLLIHSFILCSRFSPDLRCVFSPSVIKSNISNVLNANDHFLVALQSMPSHRRAPLLWITIEQYNYCFLSAYCVANHFLVLCLLHLLCFSGKPYKIGNILVFILEMTKLRAKTLNIWRLHTC